MTERRVSWLRRRLGAGGRERGMVEAGIAAAGGLLVVGAVVGNGIAASVMDMSDGQTWLPEDDGSVVQINPATGQPEQRLVIGADGSEMSLVQGDGYLVVTDTQTGLITSIDLAGLIASRPIQGDADTRMLVGGGQMIRVDLSPGTVRAVDPLTLADLGTPYRTEDLADAVIDREGSVWVVTEDGDLRELDFVPAAGEFSVSLDRPVTGAGPGSRLVPHAAGVSLFGPDGGAVLQVGAGSDLAVGDSTLTGSVLAADFAPAELAPASATDEGLVFMLSDRRLLRVDVGSIGCERPLRPAVLADRVYVPCAGQGTVLVLGADGERAGEDVRVPGGGDADLVVDDGRLVVHDPTDGRIVVVQQDGSTQVTDVAGSEVPVVEPTPPDTTTPPVVLPPITPPTTPPVTPPVTPPTDPTDPTDPFDPADPTDPSDPDSPEGPEDPDDPTDGGEDPTDGGQADPDLAPRDVSASTRTGGSVEVTWRAPVEPPLEYLVRTSDGAPAVTVAAGTLRATLADVVCGSDVTVTVYADHGGDDGLVGASDDVVTPDCAQAPDPGALTPGSVQAARAGDDVIVGWDAPSVEPERYLVEGNGRSEVVPGGESSVVLADLACGTDLAITVTAVHLAGGEHTASSDPVPDACVVDPADLDPGDVTISRVDTAVRSSDVRVSWSAPALAPQGYTLSVTNDDSVRQDAAPGTTTAVMAVPCGDPIQVVVTATHVDGTGEGRSNTLANDCGTPPTTEPTTPPPTAPAAMTAPTNVQAVVNGSGSVDVSWGASSPAAENYVVRSTGGDVSMGTALAHTLNLPPGQHPVQVIAQRDGYTEAASAVATVTVPAPATAPGAPGGVGGAFVSHTGTSEAVVDVTWTAPADGGSALTGYTVTGQGGASATAPAGATTARLTVPCAGDPLCTTGGSAAVSVTATNAVGSGPAGSGAVAVGPNANVPQNGDAVLVGETSMLGNSTFRGTITYQPTAAWASFPGTCTASVDSGPEEVISCSTPTELWTGAAPRNVGLDGSVTVTATGNGVTATTSEYVSRAGEGYCDANGCYQIASLDTDDPEVEVVPAPWAPPEVPHPPVLIAGAGLLLGAGTLRVLRRSGAGLQDAHAVSGTTPHAHPDVKDPR